MMNWKICRIFARLSSSSWLRFFLLLISETSKVMLLFYTTLEVYTIFGITSQNTLDGNHMVGRLPLFYKLLRSFQLLYI